MDSGPAPRGASRNDGEFVEWVERSETHLLIRDKAMGFAKAQPILRAMASEEVEITCACGNEILIDKVWEQGGINDKGGYTLRCNKCETVFEFELGKDINSSRVRSGAKLLATYDDEIGNRAAVLKKFGIPE
jgi:hypothetical protein